MVGNTEVIPITGQVTDQISTENFGQTDGWTIPATTYTMNAGDSGQLLMLEGPSRTNLDLIYKVISTDESLASPKKVRLTVRLIGFYRRTKHCQLRRKLDCRPYYGANNVNLTIKSSPITRIFNPCSRLFLSQRILIWHKDSRPILPTLTVIPKTTNLATDSSGVIYDTTSPVPT
ncbi:MAG: hypothetical protein ACLRPQ_01735 [Streptococcus sp.]